MREKEFINDITTRICQKICDKEFSSFNAIQQAFEAVWVDVKKDALSAFQEENDSKVVQLIDLLSDLCNFPPSLLQYVQKRNQKKYLFPLLKLFQLPDVEFWSLPKDSALFKNIRLQMETIQKLIEGVKAHGIAKQPSDDVELNETVSRVLHENLLHSMHAVLTNAYALEDGILKKLIIREAKISLESQGLKLIEFDGENFEDFKVKKSFECKVPQMVSATLLYEETGEIFREGVVFVPNED